MSIIRKFVNRKSKIIIIELYQFNLFKSLLPLYIIFTIKLNQLLIRSIKKKV
ncbi:hypothetical protein LCGC14_0993300 [marine sediment metagenome]|uniref:Uncharacterized protein n=1 Tax=marine sediment metagenome TaxID=412755 RepID=A0A0F9NRJ4_9ZZZZ